MKEIQSIFDYFETTEIDIKKSKIAADLCALLVYCNLSRTDIAEKLGQKKSYVSRMLSGKQNLTIKSILEFSLALGYDFEVTFFSKEEDRPTQPWEERLYHQHLNYQENSYFIVMESSPIDTSIADHQVITLTQDKNSDLYYVITNKKDIEHAI